MGLKGSPSTCEAPIKIHDFNGCPQHHSFPLRLPWKPILKRVPSKNGRNSSSEMGHTQMKFRELLKSSPGFQNSWQIRVHCGTCSKLGSSSKLQCAPGIHPLLLPLQTPGIPHLLQRIGNIDLSHAAPAIQQSNKSWARSGLKAIFFAASQ